MTLAEEKALLARFAKAAGGGDLAQGLSQYNTQVTLYFWEDKSVALTLIKKLYFLYQYSGAELFCCSH